MNGLPSFDSTFWLHSALTLLHFLWQGLLLAVVVCVAAWCLRNRSAAARYRLHAATLLLMPVCLPVTFMFLHQEEVRQAPDLVLDSQAPAQPFDVVLPIEVPADTPHATALSDTSTSTAMEAATAAALSTNLPAGNLTPVDSIVSPASTDSGTSVERVARWTTAAYLIGVGLMFVRMLLGFAGTRRLRRDVQRIDDTRLLQSIERRARQFRLRSAPLVAYCNRVGVPALAGLWRPMILLPAALATGLTPEQLDLVVMHEMAHIRRWDNFWLVVQRTVESILFFHPAVWYVSRRMSIERELCCDEMVVGMAARRVDYAESLLRVVELTTDKQLAVPATATMASPRDGSAILVHRLMRILGEPKSSPVRLLRLWPTAIMAVLVIAAIGFVRLSVYAEPTDSAPEQAVEQEPTEEPGKTEEPAAGDDSSSGLIETLPDGGYVKLVAVNEYPGTLSPAWSPDGRDTGKPLPPPDHKDRSTVYISPNYTVRRFRLEIQSTAEVTLLCWDRGNLYAPELPHAIRLKGQSEPRTWDVVFTLSEKQKTIDLFVDVSEGWERHTSWDEGQRPVLVETTDGVRLEWKVDRPVLARRQFRAVVADSGGRDVPASAEAGPSLGHRVPLVFRFPTLTVDEVQNFRLESCRYTTVGFHDVSLESGYRTKPATGVTASQMNSARHAIPRLEEQLEKANRCVADAQHALEDGADIDGNAQLFSAMQDRRSRQYGIHQARRIASYHAARDRSPFTELYAVNDVPDDQKTLARLIARHELFKVHYQAQENPNPAVQQHVADLAARLMEPRDVGVKWHCDIYNPNSSKRARIGSTEEMLLAEMPANENEIFYRSGVASVGYLMRVPMERDCLACHESRLTPFADGDVAPQDRLEVGDVLAAVRVEIMPKWAVEASVDLNDAYPNVDASNEPFEGTVSPGGSCRDGDGNPVADAEVVLYQLDWNTRSQTVVERSRTDRQGRFRFRQVPVSLDQTEKYGIVARAAGLTTEVQCFPYRTCWGDEIEQIELTMEKASEIHGRVTGPDGAPVERAMVWTESPLYDPIVGIHCALTDADGRFVIDDVAPRDRDSLRQTRVLPGGREVITISDNYRLCCRHPKFAHQWQGYVEVPSEVRFSLGLGAALEGRIVYAGSNEPAAGVGVRIISAKEGDYRQGVTDEQGRYRFVSLRGEKYNIWPVSTEWTAPAIDSIRAVSGETTKAPDVRLVRGAVIRGRLVHGVTGKPLTLAEFCTPVDQRVSVYLAVKGPDRPNSGPVHHGVTFRNDGSFEVRLPPGESMITFTPPKPWKMFNSAIGVEKTLSLVDGQDRRLDLWVIRR